MHSNFIIALVLTAHAHINSTPRNREMDEAELSAVRDFVDPSVFQWLFSDGSLESEVSEAPNPAADADTGSSVDFV